MINSKSLDGLIKIADELIDNYNDFKAVYLDANKRKGKVDLNKFSFALANFDFNLDRINSIIDFLQADNGKLK